MAIIWQGRGIVVLFVFIAACVAGITLTVIWIAPAMHIDSDERGVNLAIAVSTFLSAVAIYPFGRFVMKPQPEKIVVDPRTGEPCLVRPVDTFCFIDIRYWTHIFLLLTAIMLVVTYFS